MFQVIDLRPKDNLGNTILTALLAKEGLNLREERLKLDKQEFQFKQEQQQALMAEQGAATAAAAAQIQAGTQPGAVTANRFLEDPVIAQLIGQMANANQGGGAAQALPAEIARVQFDQPTSVGELAQGGKALGAPAALTTRQGKQKFPTQLEGLQDQLELDTLQLGMRIRSKLNSGELTGSDLATLVQANPAIGGALQTIGADTAVNKLIDERIQARGEERRFFIDLRKAEITDARGFIKDNPDLRGVITPEVLAGVFSGRLGTDKLPEGVGEEVLQAVSQQRLVHRAAVLEKLRQIPTIRALEAFQRTALASGKDGEEQAVAIQSAINKELKALLGPDAEGLLPEFAKVPGAEGVTPGGRTLISDPGDQAAVEYLFNVNGGDLDASLTKINTALDNPNLSPEDAAQIRGMLPLLTLFAENEGAFRRFRRGLSELIGTSQPKSKR